MELLIGADPEIWIKDNTTGKIISAHGLFPGTKDAPYAVEHGAIQVDGMAAEYNILPAKNAEEFIFYNLSVLRSLRDEIKARNPDLDFSFEFSPVAEFGEEYIQAQPYEAKQLGCTPDYNAWEDGAVNPTPDADMPFRTASGHIHLGWGNDYDITDSEHIEACCMMVKQLELTAGGKFVQLEGEAGKKRRELYGKSGAFRPKKYGVEWRTLSNSWLTNTFWMDNLYDYTMCNFNDLLGGFRAYDNKAHAKKYRKAIDDMNIPVLTEWWGETNLRYYDVNEPVNMETLDGLYAKYNNRVNGGLIGLAPQPMFIDDDFHDDEEMELDEFFDMIGEDEGEDQPVFNPVINPQPIAAVNWGVKENKWGFNVR